MVPDIIAIFVDMSKKSIILKRIYELATDKFPDSEIYLYGSRARNDDRKISDWDLLILINSRHISFNLETSLMDEFYELELETGEIFSPLIYSKYDWSRNHISTSLFQNIQKEGIRIK